MTSVYRYHTEAGLQWVAVSAQDGHISVVLRSSRDGVLDVSISLDEARSSIVSDFGGMLSFGEESLRRTGIPKWLDLSAKSVAAGVTIPELISRDLHDNYSVRVLVPSRSIVSLRDCDVLVYMHPEAVLLTDKEVIPASGPLESARLLGRSISLFEHSSTLPV